MRARYRECMLVYLSRFVFHFLCDLKHRADVDAAPLVIVLFYFSCAFVFRTVLSYNFSEFFSAFSAETLSQRLMCTLFFNTKKNENDREKHKTINTRAKKPIPTPNHFTKVNLNAYNTCIELVDSGRIYTRIWLQTHKDHGNSEQTRKTFS